MREKTIRKLVKLVEASEIESLTVRNWWSRVQIVKKSSLNHSNGGNGNGGHSSITLPRAEAAPTLPPAQTQPQAAAPQAVPAVMATETKPSDVTPTAQEITSPMVGTFYTSPEPGAPPFVDAGQRISKGQTVCIIEAMKLMNEIEAEFDGTIVKRLAENAEPVEFGQGLFLIEPS
jgi:acetyl-CoA carboxylase biotin carboxyl carrier protein